MPTMRAGICTTLSAEINIEFDVDWMKKYRVRGIVMWPNMRFAETAVDVPDWLFRHELEHVYQIMREGPLRFYLKYFYNAVRYGYDDNPYEVEARLRQREPFTESEEQLLWKLRNA